MTWSTVAPAVLPLIGVALGSIGSFGGQYLGTKTTRDQARATRYAALRAERKEVIREFLDAAQKVEQAAETIYRTSETPEDVRDLTHQMWFLQKCIDLVASPQLRQAAEAYAWRLDRAVYRGCPEDRTHVWEYMTEQRLPFMEAARKELDVPDPQREQPRGD